MLTFTCTKHAKKRAIRRMSNYGSPRQHGVCSFLWACICDQSEALKWQADKTRDLTPAREIASRAIHLRVDYAPLGVRICLAQWVSTVSIGLDLIGGLRGPTLTLSLSSCLCQPCISLRGGVRSLSPCTWAIFGRTYLAVSSKISILAYTPGFPAFS